MANYAEIRFRFEELPPIGDQIIFRLKKLSDSSVLNIFNETAQLSRFANYYYTIALDTDTTILNFRDALTADYGSIVDIFMDYLTNECVVRAKNYDRTFDVILANLTVFGVEYIDEVSPEPLFAINDINFSQAASNPIDNVKVTLNVSPNLAPFQITSPVSKYAETASGLFFDFARQSVGSRQVTVIGSYGGGDQKTANSTIAIVKKYFIESVTIVTGIRGATVTINKADNGVIGIQSPSFAYSLNGIDYFVSPVFTGLLPGVYTAYLIDGFGGISTLDFEIINITEQKPEPFFSIPRANPLRFVPSNNDIYQTHDNTLFKDFIIPNCEKRFFRQPFQLTNVVKTQFRSNYENNIVNVKDCNGILIDTIIPTIKIQNVGLTDKRDCFLKEGGEGKTNVFFIQGNIYDPVTDEIISEYFDGKGRLPAFVQHGMYIEITSANLNGNFIVSGIVYDNDLSAWACVIDVDYPFAGVSGVAFSKYNLELFNIYEFSLTAPGIGQYYLELLATDTYPEYDNQLWFSEPIYFDNHEDCVNISYSADENQSGIDYRTLISFDLCIPARFARYAAVGEDEMFEDDNGNTIVQRAVYIRTIQLETGMVPMWLAEKIIIASGHPNLKINGVKYVRNEKPTANPKLDDNNPFYIVTGIFNEIDGTIIGDTTGIISGQRYVLGVTENEIIGL